MQETHSFTNADIDSPAALRVLRAALSAPDELRPRETTADVTEKLAQKIAAITISLQKREAVELASAKTRKEHSVAQKKNLRIARFLNRLVFCFFAEDTGLLPKNIFGELCAGGLNDPKHFAESLEDLFECMAKGGRFGTHKIRHFNGHLFEDATVFELLPDEIEKLADAAGSDWQNIQPSIMGTLFQRALDENQRAALGAQYTGEKDIRDLLEPVLMAPLRREWREIRRALAALLAKGKATNAARDTLAAFQRKLAAIIVLDPACGSGNFLYVALQLLLALEKEIINAAAQLGFTFTPQVSVQQLRAIEINPYAYELAQVSVQIGALQWRRDNGFDNDRTPVLQNLDGFENKDALLNDQFREKPDSLKKAQAQEHDTQGHMRVYYERAWPACDVIVGNPPFLGDKFMRGELGDHYVVELRKIFGKRIPGQSDLCCYWFEKARQQIADGKCKRAGLLATQGIRGGANRAALERIKESGGIFFAESDRAWILAGANVHVSMVGFDDGTEKTRVLDGHVVEEINANLSAVANVTDFQTLQANEGIGFIGVAQKAPFDISEEQAVPMLSLPNPHGRPNSDVLIPICNAEDITRRRRGVWNVDFGLSRPLAESQLYEAPFAEVKNTVYPLRIAHREPRQTKYWWLFARPCPDMREGLHGLQRFLATPRVSKHRVFAWLTSEILCDSAVVTFARDDDYFFGVMQSHFHEIWALKLGTRLETRPRYTPTTCFETYPLPTPTPAQSDAIAAAAQELNALRERWLNPPEWTQTHTLTFPGSAAGPWARYIDPQTVDAQTGIGTVRYPRLEPRDAECAANLKKRTLTNLYNERPAWLALAHQTLDAAVAAAYGWPADMSDDEILARLLELNLARSAEEATAATAKKPRTARLKTADEML